MTPQFLRWSACLLIFVPLAPSARGADELFEQRQTAQRRAQAMTRELVQTVLDRQLRQLEENGLSEDPIYGEIADVRGDLDQLVAGSMAHVVEQLVAAELAEGPARQQQYAAAREEMRGVLLELGLARQSISRRIQSVTWLEQVARLRERQQRIHEQTAALADLPADSRSDRAVGLIADQRDLEPLFLQFSQSLEDAATWSGQTALTASLIRQWLRDQPWSTRWSLAEQQLAQAVYAEAAATQKQLVAGLEELQNRLDSSQRALSTQHGAIRQQILAMRRQQQELFETLSSVKSTPPLEHVESQQQLARQLAALTPRLIDDTDLGPLQQQATQAAEDATAALFLEDSQTGLAEQQRVLDRLDQLSQLLVGTEELLKDRSAAEIAAGIQQLERTQNELASLQESAESSEELAQRLGEIATSLHQAPLVAVRLHSASEQIEWGTEPPGPLRQAAAAVAETLADWRRAELAVRIGEISRAAEALERAAAAERGLARAIRPLVEPSSDEAPVPPPDQNAKWRTLHADAIATASATREGVGPVSPDATHSIEQALQAGRNLETTLTPDAPLTPDAADSAANDATAIARFLAEAAAELRGTIGQSAENLVSLTEEQLASVAHAGQQLEAAAQADPPALDSAARAASQVDYATTVALEASKIAVAQENPRDLESGLERAAIGLAARQKQLTEARRLSQALGQLATQQQSAVEAIDTAREQLESPAESEDADRDEQLRRQAAQSMRSATRQFAETQKETGEAASQISNQRELANDAIRQALEAAGRLPMPTPTPEMSAEELAAQQAAAEQAENAESDPEANAEQAMQAPDTKTASSGANQTEQTAGDAANQSGNSQSAGQSTAADANASAQQVMGTELVSAAADETAQMMAGADANAAMSEIDAANPDGNTRGEAGSSESDLPGDSNLNTEANSAQSSATGTSASSAAGPPAEGESKSNNRGQDASMPGGAVGDAAWWAKLPPEVRDAVRAGTSRPAPPGYEQRLKRYFESVETD